MVREVNAYWDDEIHRGDQDEFFQFDTTYDNVNHAVIMQCPPPFEFKYRIATGPLGLQNFNKILNTPGNLIDSGNVFSSVKHFPNVWDRRQLYVHCSIANTAPCNYLGHDGEFYDQPTKLYKWTSKSSTIRIWFSFDTKTPVQLYHQPVQISFQLLATVLK
jgi:hypothetical protein